MSGPLVWSYPGKKDKYVCDIHLHRRGTHAVVIVKDRPMEGPSGQNITKGAETLATLVMKNFKLAPGKLIWIEHHVNKDRYKLVQFNFDGKSFKAPRWLTINLDIVEAFISLFKQKY